MESSSIDERVRASIEVVEPGQSIESTHSSKDSKLPSDGIFRDTHTLPTVPVLPGIGHADRSTVTCGLNTVIALQVLGPDKSSLLGRGEPGKRERLNFLLDKNAPFKVAMLTTLNEWKLPYKKMKFITFTEDSVWKTVRPWDIIGDTVRSSHICLTHFLPI